MTSKPGPPRSILKNPSSQRNDSPDPRHLAIALHHAHQIQARKDAEALILEHIMTLQSLPSDPSATADNPRPTDVATFKRLLIPFQPSDYDNLMLERNIDGLCGYTLCPREHRKEDGKAQFRIHWGKKGSGAGGRGRDMSFVPRENLEKWCSDECAERALYVRVQLSDEPAWERSHGTDESDILLLEEARERKRKRIGSQQPALEDGNKAQVGPVTESLDRLNIEDQQGGSKATSTRRSQRDLALERGDSAGPLHAGRVDISIMEKEIDSKATVDAPSLDPSSAQGGSIEGYTPTSHPRRVVEDSDSDSDQDMLAQI